MIIGTEDRTENWGQMYPIPPEVNQINFMPSEMNPVNPQYSPAAAGSQMSLSTNNQNEIPAINISMN